jgi:Animal haem peroxidase
MQFRNFIRRPAAQERFGYALQGSTTDRSRRMRDIMSGVSRQMSLAWDWPNALGADVERWENPDIPAGYTYLAQFVAHDCVFTSAPTGAVSQIGVGVKSWRSSLLQLETIYGGGPDASPGAYAAQGENLISRNRLLLGKPAPPNSTLGKCPFQELGRARPTNRDHAEREGLTCALIADPRNDAHAAIAQLTTLFHQLHNKIAQIVESAGLVAGSLAADIRNYRVYLLSRAICVHVYRRLLREDLLPPILHPGIVAAYDRDDATFLDTQSPDELPTEFAHAFRFGHAMVRPNYVFNDLNVYGEDLADMMLATSGARPWRMPLDDSWMAQWSRFFAIGGDRPNLSRRIAPSLAGGLFSGEVFGPIDETQSVGLAYRDLLSSAFIPQWSVPALAAEIFAERAELAELSPLLADRTQRERQIGDWLARHRLASGLNDEDRDFLAADPPLVLYVLFEAAREMEGRRLGVLGSLILAETFYRALGNGAHASAQRADNACAFDELARVVLGRPESAPVIAACVPDIATMAALIDYVAPSAPRADLAKSPRSNERDWSEDGRDCKELVGTGAG